MERSHQYDPRDLNITRFDTKDVLKAKAVAQEGQARIWQNQSSEVNPSVRPAFLTPTGKWDAGKLPGQVIESKTQLLTAPGAYTMQGTLQRSKAVQGPKAIGAVFSYNDVSPAVNTECVHDAVSWAERTSDVWDATVQKLRTARHHGAPDRVDRNTITEGDALMLTSRGAQKTLLSGDAEAPTMLSLTQTGRVQHSQMGHMAPGCHGPDAVRQHSINSFWARMKGSGGNSQLSLRDVSRSQNTLSTHVVGGGHNSHLIGGQWRFLPRPMVGSPLFTDYYGPYDTQSGNYYGRSWHHSD